jgi:hypothetical protein
MFFTLQGEKHTEMKSTMLPQAKAVFCISSCIGAFRRSNSFRYRLPQTNVRAIITLSETHVAAPQSCRGEEL